MPAFLDDGATHAPHAPRARASASHLLLVANHDGANRRAPQGADRAARSSAAKARRLPGQHAHTPGGANDPCRSSSRKCECWCPTKDLQHLRLASGMPMGMSKVYGVLCAGQPIGTDVFVQDELVKRRWGACGV